MNETILKRRAIDKQREYFYRMVLLNKTVMFWSIVTGLVSYKEQMVESLTASPKRGLSYAENFAEAVLERARVANRPRSGGPEELCSYKEELNRLIANGQLTVGDTYGVEPLGSNYHLIVSFLELYGPIDKEIRLYDQVQRERKKIQDDPAAYRVKQLKLAIAARKQQQEHDKNVLLEKLRETSYAHVAKVRQEKKEKRHIEVLVRQAVTRMEKRYQLLMRGCPKHEIEYYTIYKKRRSYLDKDRQLLQSVGQWTTWYETYFGDTDSPMAELPKSKAVSTSRNVQPARRAVPKRTQRKP